MVVLSNPEDAPRADPHAGCCGSRGRKTPGDPIGHHFALGFAAIFFDTNSIS
jgi:hypothetical protein